MMVAELTPNNAVVYGTPVLSLVWFYLLSIDGVPSLFRLDVFNIARVDYLVIGVVAIVMANLLINFEAEIRRCFRRSRSDPGGN